MKVKDTLTIHLVHASIHNKMYNMAPNFNPSNPYASVTWVKDHYPSWQYNGADKFENIMLWCQEHYDDWWVWSSETIYFFTEEDRTLFLLKWS